MLAVRGLRIAYPTPDGEVREVVHGVDLDLRRGEIHALVGESGSGKSQIAFSAILPAEALILGGASGWTAKICSPTPRGCDGVGAGSGTSRRNRCPTSTRASPSASSSPTG